MLTYAIGDIHGCKDQLINLLKKIDIHAKNQPYKVITLGDYIDRGPDSVGVVDLIMNSDIIALKGNHEDMLLESINSPLIGSNDFVPHQGYVHPKLFSKEHLDWIEKLPLNYEDDLRFYVHAGIDPHISLKEQDKNTMLWIRHYFLNYKNKHPKYIVHGHTPMNGCVDIHYNRVNMDSGCYHSGMLSAACFNDEQEMPIDILYSLQKNPIVF